MPPRVSRKRTAPQSAEIPSKRSKTTASNKSSVFDDIDAGAARVATPAQTKHYIQRLGDSDSSASESTADHDFEDVPGVKAAHESGDDEDMEWEDAVRSQRDDNGREPQTSDNVDITDVTVTLNDNVKYGTATERAASTVKKGPSKRERQVRNGTHCLHVQSLMWHNAVRNSWLNDEELHAILIQSLPEGIRLEIDKWRNNMGMPKLHGRPEKDPARISRLKKVSAKNKSKRGGRDWDVDAERQERGKVNMSHGDPTLKLLKILTAYWRKRFVVTAPGLRKIGYMPLKRLTQVMNSWKKDKSEQLHGERIESVQHLRRLAKACEGSRDVGSQLFTALMRALGLDARMVANLQPAGIGWGRSEEAKPVKERQYASEAAIELGTSSEEESVAFKKPVSSKGKKSKALESERPQRQSTRIAREEVINLDTESDTALSSVPSDFEDNASVVDVTSSLNAKQPRKKYDRDMHYPNYWTEVLSPVSNSYIPVDPIVLSTVATNGELLSSFEPRGKRADQAKQVICYTLAHSADGTAKDVTVRYLKKHQLPGRTKGYRMPVEKIKIHDRKGKVKRYEDYDWFKTVTSLFERPEHLRTAADDLEESTDLKPIIPEVDKPKADTESLQWYKQSAEFVLERHLRREEAILPAATPVKTFIAGKGEKEVSEPVYRRKDVIECKIAESWHKLGREIRIGEQPMKLVPMRAVTTMRKREMEDIERETGEKAKQGLFARSQTQWIIPPPIGKDRLIPKNAFGNIDVYVPSMVPKGAVHIPYKGTARVCRDLDISHAEAVTGFEFGKRMAIPVITGVVVAEENLEAVLDLWKEREAIKKEKEDAKKSQACLALWRKLFTGLRIMERMKREYADTGREEDINPFVRKGKTAKPDTDFSNDSIPLNHSEEPEEGGFLRDDEHENKPGPQQRQTKASNDIHIETHDGNLLSDLDQIVDSEAQSTNAMPSVQPLSLRAAHLYSQDATPNDKDAEDAGSTDSDTRIRKTRIMNSVSGSLAEREDAGLEDDRSAGNNLRSAGSKIRPKHNGTPHRAAVKRGAANTSTKPTAAKRATPTKSRYFAESDTAQSKARSGSGGANSRSTRGGRGKGAVVETVSADEDGATAMGIDSEGDDGTGASSEAEVVTPRLTTARTRTRAAGRR